MKNNFNEFWSGIIQDIMDVIDSNYYSIYGDPVLGNVNIKKLDYPCVHIIPTRSDYQGDQEYQDIIKMNFYYKKDRSDYKYIDNLAEVEETLDVILEKLATNSSVGEYKVDSVEHLAGNAGSNLIEVISIDIFITKLLNYQK